MLQKMYRIFCMQKNGELMFSFLCEKIKAGERPERNKDDKISKEFYYLGRVNATGQVKEFVMPNTDKTAVEIEWVLDTPVREDIYEYIVNG